MGVLALPVTPSSVSMHNPLLSLRVHEQAGVHPGLQGGLLQGRRGTQKLPQKLPWKLHRAPGSARPIVVAMGASRAVAR